ncbi:hypothetical protein EAE96_000622 [Botrytis aclada]|nr:hypothetical protein EAE96_000622 [Botrytis aclada]
MKIPEYLKKTKYQNPENTNDGPFQYAMHTKLQYYDWLKTEPEQAVAFNTTMMLQRMDRGEPWYEYYPIASKIETPIDEKAPLIVDAGGNIGTNLHDFYANFPNFPAVSCLRIFPRSSPVFKNCIPPSNASFTVSSSHSRKLLRVLSFTSSAPFSMIGPMQNAGLFRRTFGMP